MVTRTRGRADKEIRKKRTNGMPKWSEDNGRRITHTEVGDDGIDVGDLDPTRGPKCCEG
jgi:hypothetical protein